MAGERKFSDEDLRELLSYLASKPAFPFPELTEEEREQLMEDVLNELALIQEEPRKKTRLRIDR